MSKTVSVETYPSKGVLETTTYHSTPPSLYALTPLPPLTFSTSLSYVTLSSVFSTVGSGSVPLTLSGVRGVNMISEEDKSSDRRRNVEGKGICQKIIKDK